MFTVPQSESLVDEDDMSDDDDDDDEDEDGESWSDLDRKAKECALRCFGERGAVRL